MNYKLNDILKTFLYFNLQIIMYNFFRQLFPILHYSTSYFHHFNLRQLYFLYFLFCFSSYTGMIIFMIKSALRGTKLTGEGAHKRGGHLFEEGTNLSPDPCKR